MARVLSGHGADFSGIVWGLTEAGAQAAPTGGLEVSPPRPHMRIRPLMQSIRLSVSSLARQGHDKRIFLGAQRF